MAEQKTFLDELADGVANAFGMSKPQPQVVKKIEKGKGVIVPKLTPIPTVKMPKNPNQAANRVRSTEAKKANGRFVKLNSRLVKLEKNQAANQKIKASLQQQIIANNKAILANKKLIEKQKRWVEFMFKKWEQKNQASLKAMDSGLRKRLESQQASFLQKQARLRIKPAPAPKIGVKKKVSSYSPGKKSLTARKRIVRRPVPVRKPIVRRPIVRRPVPVRKPIVRRPVPVRRPIVRRPVPVRKPIVRRPVKMTPAQQSAAIRKKLTALAVRQQAAKKAQKKGLSKGRRVIRKIAGKTPPALLVKGMAKGINKLRKWKPFKRRR